MKIPKSPPEITTEWLNEVLFPRVSDSKIVSIEIDKDFGPWSLLGKAVRVKITYADAESKPKSVIVKFQISCSEPKKEGEIYELLSESNLLFIPKIFGEFGNGNLVLEDLTSTHSVLKNFTIAQARNVVLMLADINSRFWGDSRFPKDDVSHFVNSININMGQGWDIFEKRYQKQLGKEAAVFEWMWKNAEIVSRLYTSNPITLNHGDVNRGNLLFSKDGSDKPMLIDWQLAGRKILGFDLSYFLVKSLTADQRRKHEDKLIREYYELLPKQIRDEYAFDRLVLNYRACLTRSMLSAVTRVSAKFNSHPNQADAADKLAIPVIEAIKDLKPIEAIGELEKRGWLNLG